MTGHGNTDAGSTSASATDDGADIAVSVNDLVVEFPGPAGAVRPLDGLDFTVPAGSLAVLSGPSGSGKTTLLSVLSAMIAPTAGVAHVGGIDVAALSGSDLERFRREVIGIVFQGFNLAASLTAAENVAMPLILAGTKRRAAVAVAEDRLAQVGLAERADHRPSELSGGQQQRVAIARGLVADAPVLLADEPTANLDPASAETVIELLRSLCRGGRTVVISTHDQRLSPLSDVVIDMVPTGDDSPDGRPPVTLAKGEVLFEAGEVGDDIFWIESGEVEVIKNGESVATVGPEAYVGELGPLLGLKRSATIQAASAAVLTPLTIAEFRQRRGRPDAG